MKAIKVFAMVLVILMAFTMLPVSALASEYTAEYDWSAGRLSIKAAGTYRVYSTADTTANDLNITNAGQVTLVLDNVTSSGTTSRIIITNSDVTVFLVGTNNLTISDVTKVGGAIVMDGTSKLTIEGDGVLNAQGGAYWATIGTKGDLQNDSAELVINSGTIVARAASNCAAIGAGRKSGVKITINGGNITAIGVTNGAGIGCGRGSYLETTNGYKCMTDITINGGIINATGGTNSAGIGGTFKGIANITVNGGIINAYTPSNGLTGVCTKGIDTQDFNGNLIITGGSVYSYNNNFKREETLVAKCHAEDTEPLVMASVELPEGSTAPYALSVNGVSGSYAALNADGKLNLYVKSSAISAVLSGTAGYIAESDSASVGASDWKTFSDDVSFVGYQKAVAESGTFDARLVASLKNRAGYSEVGFKVYVSGDAEGLIEGYSQSLYSSLNECDASGKVFNAITATSYDADGLFAAKLKGIPASGTYKITVIALAKTLDGGIAYASVYEYGIVDGVIAVQQ